MRAKLKIQPADRDSFEVDIANTATIGRSRDNTIALDFSPHVSRQHAIIRCHNAFEYQIMDLGSRNGTYVDGRRVITPVTLRHGSVIRITTNELHFQQMESAGDNPAADLTIAGTDTGLEEATDVAIMVCDIRGFSTMSELMPEENLAKLLGDWFRNAGNLVQDSGGTIDKFIGDAILAYWHKSSTPGTESQAALRIGRTLLERATSRRWPGVDAPPFRIAVALHHGTVTCGNIGLVAQRDATIIGDAVNTAFRIESTMKLLGQRLVMSGDFLDSVGDTEQTYSDLGEHHLKGKNQPVRLFGLDPL
ncbi:MAG: adenylate/guanylate cyclase domain-containing protein [Chthoniobacterales bacterium]